MRLCVEGPSTIKEDFGEVFVNIREPPMYSLEKEQKDPNGLSIPNDLHRRDQFQKNCSRTGIAVGESIAQTDVPTTVAYQLMYLKSFRWRE